MRRTAAMQRSWGGFGVGMATMAAAAAVAAHSPAPPLSGISWTQLGGGPTRAGGGPLEPGGLDGPAPAARWVVGQTPQGEPIAFVGAGGVVGAGLPQPRVFAWGTIGGQTRAVAVDAESGGVVWTAPLPARTLDSWSTPAVDPVSGVVLYASGSWLTALRMTDGAAVWAAAFPAPLVNASPLVVREGRRPGRAFIGDYGGFGAPSRLHAVNLDPRDGARNPYQPGEIVWSAPIGSATGATPAHLDGVVYVASTGLDGTGRGEIRAFDARANSAPAPLWTFTNPIVEGFYGGVCVVRGEDGPAVYAASYAPFGGLDSANLVKVDGRTGGLVWSVACNRTASIPRPIGGRVALATGIAGFGSAPSVQMFRDLGTSAVMAWDTATGTWTDADSDGVMDAGEFVALGGWTTVPVVGSGGADWMLVGTIPSAGNLGGAYTGLRRIDLSKSPGEEGFLGPAIAQAGSTPMMLGAGVYSVGPGGLAAFGPPPPRPDVDGDGDADGEDLAAWWSAFAAVGGEGDGRLDVDRSGAADAEDARFLRFEVRREEADGMAGGSR